jgi:uncharacterized membrane protein
LLNSKGGCKTKNVIGNNNGVMSAAAVWCVYVFSAALVGMIAANGPVDVTNPAPVAQEQVAK